MIYSLLAFLVVSLVAYIPTITNQPPTPDQARYKVITSTRIYYAINVERTKTIVTMRNYWERSNGKWDYRATIDPLDENVFGPIRVVDRLKTKGR